MARTAYKGHRALRRGRASLPNHVYLVTTATHGRAPIFADFQAASAAARIFHNRYVTADAVILAWVLMPDHVHWLIRLGNLWPLSTVVNRLKSASGGAVNRTARRQGPVWQRAYHDHLLRNEEDGRNAARYLVGNPVRAGLVEHVGAYPFWNAIWL